ncbi:MAG: ribonuclease HII [Ruminococcus sp.]|nr:ribonuclease HII [Ruminococcus sp.]
MAKQIIKKTTEQLYEYDAELRKTYPVLCGVDEAGRGPLAGDVYAAAVILNPEIKIDGINDSKKLSEKKREIIFDKICDSAISYCIAKASVEEIEKYNILGATMLAMQRAVTGLSQEISLTLIDGNRLPELEMSLRAIVQGDATSASIAAASILAKVSRDRALKEIDKEYPQYGFAKHKGYGTKAHYAAISEYGISPVHRPSFLKKLSLKNEND